MKYSDAKKKIDLFIQKKYPNFYKHPEYNAAITHWMQNTEFQYPYLPIEVFENLFRIFQKSPLKKNEESIIRETDTLYHPQLSFMFDKIPFLPPENPKFTFIDLFAGIGGFRIAFQNQGGKCVFSSEWDKYAQKTYEANFGEVPFGDINGITNIKEQIPNHDILCAGFPCQPFSLAGVSKKNSLGRKHGFEDKTQGTLFFNIAKIIDVKRPKAFFLENVKNLLRHNKGETFNVIRKTLEEDLGYVINYKIVDGKHWVPQHRERLFIIGYNPDKIKGITRKKIIIPETPDSVSYKYKELQDIIGKNVTGFTLGIGTWNTLIRHKANHKAKGNGFGYGIHNMPIKKGEITRTISARYHKDGAEILIDQKDDRPRRLTVEEAMQLQGYDPNVFTFSSVSKTQAYRQIGNSVVVPAIQKCAGEIIKTIESEMK